MMWPGRFEPLFDQRLSGELIRYLWKQEGMMHFIRAEWVRGENPWDLEVLEHSGLIRHQVIEEITARMQALILEKTGKQAAA